jgi:hypothetical protein
MPAAPVKFAYWVPDVSGGRRVLPLVREPEARLPDGKPQAARAHA